jgi:hypothetical protein
MTLTTEQREAVKATITAAALRMYFHADHDAQVHFLSGIGLTESNIETMADLLPALKTKSCPMMGLDCIVDTSAIE